MHSSKYKSIFIIIFLLIVSIICIFNYLSEEFSNTSIYDVNKSDTNYLVVSKYNGPNGPWLKSPIKRSSIESISFTTTNKLPKDIKDNYWDVSSSKNGSILAWYTDSDLNGLYEVTIGQEGGVIANPDSSDLFYLMLNLKEINFDNFDTSNVNNMANMFALSMGLTSLDLSDFDTSNVTDMSRMFEGSNLLEGAPSNWQSSLKAIDLSSFDTSKVVDMSYMFYDTKFTSLDLSNFDTSNVLNMSKMFMTMDNLEVLDISSFNSKSIKNVSEMFSDDVNLKTIYISNLWNIYGDVEDTNMFYNTFNIIGNNKVTYNKNKIDVSMANYQNGYFTYKVYS